MLLHLPNSAMVCRDERAKSGSALFNRTEPVQKQKDDGHIRLMMNSLVSFRLRNGRLRLSQVSLAACVAAGLSMGMASMAPARADTTADLPRATNFTGAYLSGLFASNQRDKAAAYTFLAEALRLNPNDAALLDRAFYAAVQAGAAEDAFELATRVHELEPTDQLARIVLGVRAFRARQFAEARRMMGTEQATPVMQLAKSLLTAWTFAGSDQLGEALEAVDAIDDLGNSDIRWIKSLATGLIAEYFGDLDIAVTAFEASYEANPGLIPIVTAYTRLLARTDQADKALEILRDLDARVPGQDSLLSAIDAIENGRTPGDAIDLPVRGGAESLFNIGSALGRDPQDETAVLFFQLTLMMVPEHTGALLGLGAHLMAVEDYDQAIVTFLRVPEDSPERLTADLNRARALNDLEQTEEALALVDTLAESNPGQEVFFTQASILHGHKDYLKAADAYTRAIANAGQVDASDWYLFYYRGMVRERGKRWPQAERDFQRALELNPDQPYVLNYLGYTWIDKGLNLEEALEMVRKAVSLRPQDGDITDSLGWAYYRLGDYDQAVKYLERAVELRPEEPVIHDHLGDAYWKVGRKREARFQWAHARDLDPDPEVLASVIEKLANGLYEEQLPARAEAAE
jgi:tetratricopeptide (TPR) repeat protein